MFLTYSSIVATYVPQIEAAEFEAAASTPSAATADGNVDPSIDSAALAGDGSSLPTAEAEEVGITELPAVIRYSIVFVLVFVNLIFSLPKNLIGIIIIGIALYEAWKINKRPVINITGPYQVGGPRPGDSTEATDPIV